MDIWDSLRLVRRHWRLTLPMIVIGLLLSAFLYSTGSTTWKVQTSVMLLGPDQTVRNVGGEVITEDQNPYLVAGEAMPLTRVIVHAMKDPSVLTSLSEAGLSTDFSQVWDNRQPLINTSVIADTPEVAQDTAERLLLLTASELDARQTEVGAPDYEHAVQSVLSVSDPKEDFKVPRLLFGVGLATTIVATIAAAFSLEWWRRRGEEDLEGGWAEGERLDQSARTVRVVPDAGDGTIASPAPAASTHPQGGDDAESGGSGSRWGRREAN